MLLSLYHMHQHFFNRFRFAALTEAVALFLCIVILATTGLTIIVRAETLCAAFWQYYRCIIHLLCSAAQKKDKNIFRPLIPSWPPTKFVRRKKK